MISPIERRRNQIERVRACENITQAEVIVDHIIEEAINLEREQCALSCEEALSFDPDDPGSTYAAIIRSRKDEFDAIMKGAC